MKIDYLQFYVDDVQRLKHWFVSRFGFSVLAEWSDRYTYYVGIQSGLVYFLLSSPLSPASSAARFLQQHPPGVADVVFQVNDIVAVLKSAIEAGASLLEPLQTIENPQGRLRWSQIAAWGTLRHTLIQREGITPIFPFQQMTLTDRGQTSKNFGLNFDAIDHVVLNVEAGALPAAVHWYERVLGFQQRQGFLIETERSALSSQVLICDHVQLPINEPASANSQIQEFLTYNRGAGIQHTALRTSDAIEMVATLRRQGVAFLEVPQVYYTQLKHHWNAATIDLDWDALVAQEILLDWPDDRPQALLLQTFTQPIFAEPTFFFEIIERRTYQYKGQLYQAQGFGEGNFQALFEAIEREQTKRGSLA